MVGRKTQKCRCHSFLPSVLVKCLFGTVLLRWKLVAAPDCFFCVIWFSCRFMFRRMKYEITLRSQGDTRYNVIFRSWSLTQPCTKMKWRVDLFSLDWNQVFRSCYVGSSSLIGGGSCRQKQHLSKTAAAVCLTELLFVLLILYYFILGDLTASVFYLASLLAYNSGLLLLMGGRWSETIQVVFTRWQ